MRIKRLLAGIICFILCFGSMGISDYISYAEDAEDVYGVYEEPVAVEAEPVVDPNYSNYDDYGYDLASGNSSSSSAITYTKSGYTSLSKPTQEQIIAKRKEAYAIIASNRFTVEPSSVSPYSTGTLDSTFLKSGEAYLNYNRYIAGLGSVTLDSSLNTNAQYGAVLLAAVDELTHTPAQPSDMSDDFYNLGYSATTSSNISLRYGFGGNRVDMIRSSIIGCMADNNSQGNLETMGHRRWFLNPSLGKIGFGCADSVSDRTFIVNKVFDRSATVSDYNFISWPASGNFPSELAATNTPWSITLNPNIVDSSTLSDANIVITRVSDGKTWTINKSNELSDVTTGTVTYFKVNTDGYGINNCIIFNIGTENLGADSYLGKYKVKVTGLKDKSAKDIILDYETNFFTESIDISKISFGSASLSIDGGETASLVANIYPSDATNKNLTWTSSDTSIATVQTYGTYTNYGYIIGKKAGTVTITCKATDGSGVKATCKVTVKPVLVTKIILPMTSFDMNINATTTINAAVIPDYASNKKVTWTSSNTNVATVSVDGDNCVIKAKKAGTAVITCKAADGSGVSATCKVTVNARLVSQISLNYTSASMYVNDVKTLTKTITPNDATDKSVTWSSSNTKVATVDSQGIVTAKGAGSAVITCKANDGSGANAK
ncbi:MAG: Ig-like domain-containing protein, partial [Lachnospiraceae bacterium]|nr:Ig-like domain-containing protein [Lachnospiraceae bacterium]